MADAKRDDNFVPTLLAVSSVDGVTPVPVYANPITHRLLVDIPSGSGTVSDVSVVSANGFAGTVATSTTTPAITLTTTVTGILKGNGTAVSAITVGSGLSYDGTTLSATAGGGNVSNTGTPVNNQIAVWTDATTIEGDAGLTFDTATDLLTTGILNATSLTASEIVITDASKNLVSAAVATYPSLTELTYLKGVTSAIQTQLNAKGTGNVSKVGTPVDSQVGVWTGDGTIEGDTAFTFDTSTDTLTVTGATPTLNVLSTDNSELEFFADADASYLKIEDTGTANYGAYIELYKNSASPAANDSVGLLYFAGEDSAGNKQNYASISGIITSPTTTAEVGQITFALTTAGTLADRLTFYAGSVVPVTNDTYALGSATNQFSDLFLAEGGVINWDNGDATLTQAGNVLTLDGADFAVTNIELGHATDTTVSRSAAGVIAVEGVVIPSISSTNTLTNKRITKRTGTTTSSATPTINTDNVDEYYITAQTEAITSFTTNLSGTPTLGQTLFISVIGTAARAITWGASFANGPVALPTTTVTTTQLSTLFKWDGSVWRCYATGSTV